MSLNATLSLANCLNHWDRIAKGLQEPRRQRRRQVAALMDTD
jgi:hypothetical protein